MEPELQSLQNLFDPHGECGKQLFEACKSEIFPCDALAFAVLERSLNLLRGFHLLLENGGYTPGMGLLRMQLDNVLRFNGVANSEDPHGVANSIMEGVALRNIHDRSGKKMTDAHLVKMLAAKNHWVNHVYKLACGYVHLSDQHIRHFLIRSKENEAGLREFGIGDEDGHVNIEYKIQAIKAFSVLTAGVLEIVRQWSTIRHAHGTNDELRSRFGGS